MLRGIETLLNKLDDLDTIQSVIEQFAETHARYDVCIDTIPIVADSFEAEILLYCRSLHDEYCSYNRHGKVLVRTLPKQKSHSADNIQAEIDAESVLDCTLCKAWHKFFDLVNILMIAGMLNYHKKIHQMNKR